MLWLDLGAEYGGYWCDFCRAGIVGEISEERIKFNNDVYEATMEAAKAIRPGTKYKDLAYECGKGLEKRGHGAVAEMGRVGHGMGLMSTEPPSITLHEEGELFAGMIVNIEPTLIEPHGVYCLEEDFIVTEDGCECLTHADRMLHRIRTL